MWGNTHFLLWATPALCLLLLLFHQVTSAVPACLSPPGLGASPQSPPGWLLLAIQVSDQMLP